MTVVNGIRAHPAAAAPLEADAALRLLIEQTPVVLWTTDSQWRFTSSQGGGLTRLGLVPEAVVGLTLFEYFGSADEHFAPIAAHRRAFAGESVGYETEWNGRVYRSQVEPLIDADGNPAGVVGIAFDITERTQIEAALRASEARFKGAFDCSPTGMALIDLDGHWLQVNPALCAALGYSEAELVGRKYLELTHPDDRHVGPYGARRAIEQTGTPFEAEKRYLHKSGRVVSVLLHAMLVRDGDQPSHFIVQLQDITRRKELEAQLIQSQKLEAIGQLAGGIAHDFNNLLTAISGYTAFALDRAGDPDLRADLGEVAKTAERAAALTRQLLAFSRKQVLDLRVLDLNPVVRDAEQLLARVLGDDIIVTTDLEPDLWPVRADATQLDQVLVNLAVNARDAMPEGGTLSFRAANRHLDDATAQELWRARPGDYVVISVSDSGCGMDEQTRSRVFEPFFTTKGAGHGTGLGLSTVYGIVKQSGGYITVASEPGRGTEFVIYLPRSAGRPEHIRATETAAGEIAGGSEQVLIVEDDPVVRALMHEMLTSFGYSVVEAASPEAALALAADLRFDLVVSDLVMPKLSGTELAERLRRRHPKLKILYVSGYAEHAVRERALAEPDVAFLGKPFTMRELAAAVRELADRADAR